MNTGFFGFPQNDPYVPASKHQWYTIFLGDKANAADATFDGIQSVNGLVPVSNVYTLTGGDRNFGNVTIYPGVTLKTGGFRLFCNGTFTNYGTVDCSGGDAVGATGGAATAAGCFKASGAGGTGIAAGSAVGGSVSASLGIAGGGGGTSGVTVHAGATAGATTAITSAQGGASSFYAHNTFHALTQFTGMSGVDVGGGTGGGSGGGDGTNAGGGGGGGGGVVWIACINFNNNGGIIQANGGKGANGTGGNAGGGGGGGGGAVYIFCVNNLGTGIIQGLGGSPGLGVGTGSASGNSGFSSSTGSGLRVFLIPAT